MSYQNRLKSFLKYSARALPPIYRTSAAGPGCLRGRQQFLRGSGTPLFESTNNMVTYAYYFFKRHPKHYHSSTDTNIEEICIEPMPFLENCLLGQISFYWDPCYFLLSQQSNTNTHLQTSLESITWLNFQPLHGFELTSTKLLKTQTKHVL